MAGRRGILITFSGADGSGKSTLADVLAASLRSSGRDVMRLWLRAGSTRRLERLKTLSRKLTGSTGSSSYGTAPPQAPPKGDMRPVWLRRVSLVVALLDLYLIALQTRSWLKRGKAVVSDRYVWDTLVDFRVRFPTIDVEHWSLWRLLERTLPRPAIAFLLIVSADEAERRKCDTDDPILNRERLRDCCAQYQELAREADFQVLDACRPMSELAQEVAHGVERL